MWSARGISSGSRTSVTVQRKSAMDSLGGLKIVCCMNFCLKCVNNVVVVKAKQNKETTTNFFFVFEV